MGCIGYTPPWLNVSTSGTATSLRPPVSGSLLIYGGSSTRPYVVIENGGDVTLWLGTGRYFELVDNTTQYLAINYSTPDVVIDSQIADKNIFLKTAGTGVIKFGSYTAGAATDSTGYITILDAAGNTRKLMVQA